MQAGKFAKPRMLSVHRKLENNSTLDRPRISGSHKTDRTDRGRKLQSSDDVTVVGHNRRRKRRKRIRNVEEIYRIEIRLRLDAAPDFRLEPESFVSPLLHVFGFRRLSGQRGLVPVLEQGRSKSDVLHPEWPLFSGTTRYEEASSAKHESKCRCLVSFHCMLKWRCQVRGKVT